MNPPRLYGGRTGHKILALLAEEQNRDRWCSTRYIMDALGATSNTQKESIGRHLYGLQFAGDLEKKSGRTVRYRLRRGERLENGHAEDQ